MRTRLNEVFTKTSEISHSEPEIVASVMGHVFNSLSSYLKNPTSPGVRYPHFGVIRPHLPSLNHFLSNLLPYLRAHPEDEKAKEKFRRYWKVRDIVIKDNERRDYKKRYGSWHYKEKDQPLGEEDVEQVVQ